MRTIENETKPIQTYYNGYHFRSRLEARWAVFFDEMEIEYEYEPEGFELGDGVRYLPDFYLPASETWIEIKGKRFLSEEEKEKIGRFCSSICPLESDKSFYLFGGPIRKEPGDFFGKPVLFGFCFWPKEACKFMFIPIKNEENSDWGLGCLEYRPVAFTFDSPIWTKENVEKALLKARQARFEFGETPKGRKRKESHQKGMKNDGPQMRMKHMNIITYSERKSKWLK